MTNRWFLYLYTFLDVYTNLTVVWWFSTRMKLILVQMLFVSIVVKWWSPLLYRTLYTAKTIKLELNWTYLLLQFLETISFQIKKCKFYMSNIGWTIFTFWILSKFSKMYFIKMWLWYNCFWLFYHGITLQFTLLIYCKIEAFKSYYLLCLF